MSDRNYKHYRQITKSERNFLKTPRRPWAPLTAEMLESPAWRALSRAAIQLLSLLIIENCHHAGKENGRLAAGYDQIEAYGLHRSMILQTITEVTSLGFVECTRAGRRAYGLDPGRRATFRLTFLGTVGDGAGAPTNEWKAIKSNADAKAIVRAARAKDKPQAEAIRCSL